MTLISPRARFSRYPLFWLSICFAAGILAFKIEPFDFWLTLAVCCMCGIAAFLFRQTPTAPALISLSFILLGATSFAVETHSVRSDRIKVLYDTGIIPTRSPVEIEGVLTGSPELSRDGVFVTVRAEKMRFHAVDRAVSGKIRLFLPSSNTNSSYDGPNNTDLKYGSRIRVACELERDDEYLNPGVLPKKDMLDRIDIDATATIKSSLLIEHLSDESVFLPVAWVYDQRANLIDDLRKNLNAAASGVMIASLLGDKYFLDKNTADLFREGGTFHILVISGLHITFIGGLLLLLIRQFTRNRWLHFTITITFLWAYTLAVGAEPPVVRAALMFTIVLLGYAIYRQGYLLNSLGLCALVLLAWQPSDLFNPSLQLTFVSVGAIVAAAYPLADTLRRIGSWMPTKEEPFPPDVPKWLRRFCEMLYWRDVIWSVEKKRQIWSANLFKSPYLKGRIGEMIQRIGRYVFEGILISFVVQMFMLPLMVVYFHRVSVASILLNLWVGFFIAVESFTAVLGAVLSHVSELLAAPLFSLANISNWCMLALPRLLWNIDWVSFRIPAYTGYGQVIYFLYFVPLILLAITLHRWDPFRLRSGENGLSSKIVFGGLAGGLALLLIIVFHPFSSPPVDGRLHIDFLDVGQGDSALVTFPNGETLLVDGGGMPRRRQGNNDADDEPFEPDLRRIGEAVVSEVLWAKGYSHLNYVLATHADADHIQGLTDVAKNFDLDAAMVARTPSNSSELSQLAEVLQRRQVPVHIAAQGDLLSFGDARVEILWPPPFVDREEPSDNNHSIVLRIVYDTRAFLLTGDIEKEAEMSLINGAAALTSDLIKVAHHGSRTSSTQQFIDAVNAKVAVISVGRYSRFGHPHPDIVERWKASGASIRTTGERGMISVSTDGVDLKIDSFQK